MGLLVEGPDPLGLQVSWTFIHHPFLVIGTWQLVLT